MDERYYKNMNEELNHASCQPAVIGSFYSDNFGFETIEFENTQDGTILIICDSPEDLVSFEMSKDRAVKMALAVLNNCL
jgi:hypothetical protein